MIFSCISLLPFEQMLLKMVVQIGVRKTFEPVVCAILDGSFSKGGSDCLQGCWWNQVETEQVGIRTSDGSGCKGRSL